MTETPSGTAAGLYHKLTTDRDPYLDRAREASKVTIPSIMPPDGTPGGASLYRPYQSVGARGVNNLTSKLTLSLLPANSPFFRLRVEPAVEEQMEGNEDFKTEIEKALSKYERIATQDIEQSGDRVGVGESLKHLIIVGNVLLYLAPEGLKVFHLDRYVVRRDPMGRVVEIVVRESFDPQVLPDNLQELAPPPAEGTSASTTQKTLDVYTHIARKNEQWFVYQEVNGQRVPGSEGQYPLDKSPWLALRLVRIDGEDYGRGYVEEYLGDLSSLESLSKSIVEGSAAAAKVLFLVKPNGTTSAKTLSTAPNGAIREGNAADVTTIQLDKFADFRVAVETMNRIEDRLAMAFLLNTSVQRNAERVTAEEIRYMAQELDDALGGIYATLTQEFQLPYVNRKLALLHKKGSLPRLPKGVVRPQIVTGLEALGRGHDRNKLVQFAGTISQVLGPQAVERWLNVPDFISRLAAADGVDTDGLVRTQEQVQQEEEARQKQAMLANATPEVVKQVGTAAQKGMTEQ